MKRPLIIGLTGSIGMGKSAIAAMFAELGIPVFDADAAVHEMQAASGEAVAAIEAAFPGTTGPRGVDRQLLGAAVLSDRNRLTMLEAIIHPAVARRRHNFVEANTDAAMLVFDVPLLFEKGGEANVDVIVVASAPFAVQQSRVLARPGMDLQKFEHIRSLQMDDSDKRARADHIIDTGQSIDKTRDDVRALVEKLRAGLA
jgi:dephospho-CoA kinase